MPLSDEEVVSIIDSHRRQSLGDETTELSSERATAMDHYHGRPYGDEQDGRSQVVSKDLADTVGWIMPAIMEVFVKSGNLADFSPMNEDDEALADQESDYINQVIMKDNDGWIMLHDWVKDALILKNGYVKHWWDESETTKEREYEGLNALELAKLEKDLNDEGSEVEVLEHDSRIESTELGDVEVFDVKLRITNKRGRVRIEAIPTEEIRISKRARGGTQDSGFIEHFTTKTRTELIEMGMDEDFVNNLPAKNSSDDNDTQSDARDSVTDESDQLGQAFDRSMDDIDYGEAYIKIDYDKDGKAELRKIITVANKIPEGDEWNEVIDTVAITSVVTKRVPHRHIGESIDDDLADLQRIKTVLQRQLLDNIYITNNQQFIVNNRVHIPDFLQSLPGGVKRVNDDLPVTGSVEPVISTPIVNQILPAIDYIDNVKDERTGVNALSTNVDPDVLKQANNATFMEGVNRASQKVQMILRMIGETGVRELILRTHEILIKHQNKPRMVKLRGKYVNVNPTEWRDRTDLTVKIGLGTGTEEEKRQKLSLVNALQESLAEKGLVGPEEAYNLFDQTLETINIENAEQFAINPKGEKYAALLEAQQNQPPPPNPLAEAEAVKGQIQKEQTELKAEVEIALAKFTGDQKVELEELKLRVDSANKEADRISKETIEAAKLEIQAMLEGFKVDLGEPGVGAGLQEKTFDPNTGTFI